jgi:hypothetical protein
MTKSEQARADALDCKAVERFGPHGGRQFKSVRYMFCGCDVGQCENHAMNFPLGPKYVPGKPQKCRKHRGDR